MAGGGPSGPAPYTAGFSAEPAGAAAGGSAAAADASGAFAGGTAGAAATEDNGGAGTTSGGYGGGAAAGGYGSVGGMPPNPSADALSLPRAGFWVRMLALLIDAILVGAVLSVSVLDHHHQLQLIALATYGAIMWKLKGTTVGGIVCNLKVVRIDGRSIDWSTSIVRALSCFLSLVVCGLGFIWIAFDQGRQGWHDKIAGTAVVRVPQGVSLL
jgi:uncharacterized RDD family membrane protein YckC